MISGVCRTLSLPGETPTKPGKGLFPKPSQSSTDGEMLAVVIGSKRDNEGGGPGVLFWRTNCCVTNIDLVVVMMVIVATDDVIVIVIVFGYSCCGIGF